MSDGGITKDGTFARDNTKPPNTDRVLPLFSLKGKTAIVSGAGSGIGLQVAHALAEAGANVAIWYNSNKEALDRAAEIEKEYGVKCKSKFPRRVHIPMANFSVLLGRAYQVNVLNEDKLQASVDEQVKEFNGRLDIFVANAGIPWTQGEALKGEVSHYHKVVGIDLDGVFLCARAAGKHFKRQKFEGTTIDGKPLENFTYGSFIATASMSGHIVNFPQLQAAYNAAKAAVIHLCRSFAVEWVKFARVNTISPGYINTEISNFVPPETKAIWRSKTPMGREGEPGELKGAYLYLASDASSFTTGTDIIVDGGYCVP